MTDKNPKASNLIGVFATLAQQHAQASELLTTVKNDPSKRSELWPTIRVELVSHEQSEIRELYPVFRQFAEIRALADEHDGDASQLSATIARIDALPFDDAEWGATFEKLVALVTQHVDEEEGAIFPRGQAVIGKERAEDLERPLLLAKSQVADGL